LLLGEGGGISLLHFFLEHLFVFVEEISMRRAVFIKLKSMTLNKQSEFENVTIM